MNKKFKIFFLFLLSMMLLVGCEKSNNIYKQNDKNLEEALSEEENEFPKTFEYESEKVKFDCELELPENFVRQNLHKITVLGQCYADSENVVSNYVQGEEVSEKYEYPADDGMPGETTYVLENGGMVGLGGTFTMATNNSKYYSYVGTSHSDNQEEYSSGKITFASPEEAIEAVKQELNKIGYSQLEFQYESYPLNHETMKKMEIQYMEEEFIREDQKKDTWGEEDDAYFVYAYQTEESLPIFHELMSLEQAMAYDTPDNGPVQSTYSSRGIEDLLVGPVYNFESTDELVSLKDFDEIARTVSEKFENILNDAHYVVSRAKLYEMVHLDESQKYVAEPIWYFEIIENENIKSVTLINAVTGKEIF